MHEAREPHPVEAEIQMIAPSGAQPLLPEHLAGLTRSSVKEGVHHDTYLDTVDGAINAAGLAFRIRRPQDNSDGTWTLKLADQTPDGDMRSRVEMEWPERQIPSTREPLTSEEYAVEVAAYAELRSSGVSSSDIQEVGTVIVKRIKATYAHPDAPDDALVELAWDHTSYPDGYEELRVEVETFGHEGAVTSVARELNEACGNALEPCITSKGQALRAHLRA